MKTNEKAPDALAGNLSAIEINHLQDNPDFGNCQEPVDPVIPELLKTMRKGETVNISDADRFFGLFSFGSYDVDGSGRYSAKAGGVEFYCLVGRGGRANVEMQ